MNWRSKRCVLAALVLGLAACGSSAGSLPGSATPASMAVDGAVAALASKLGISPDLVAAGLAAAKAALGGTKHTLEDKALAAQVGVDHAATKAEASGKALADEQKSGLLEGLKNML